MNQPPTHSTSSGQAHSTSSGQAIGHQPLQTRPWFQSAGVLFGYTLLTLILTYPLIFNLTSAVPNDIGDPLLNTWILAWDTHALLTDPLNFFNANIFYPLISTLAYSEHLLSTALLILPVQVFSGEPVLAYNVSLLLTFPLAGFGMYLLAWRWTHQRGAAFIAGLVFAFTPYRLAAIAHLQLLTFQWLPYALLCLDLLLAKGPGNRGQGRISPPILLLVFGVFFLLQVLASWYLALYTALILGIYLLAILIARRPPLARLMPIFVTLLLATLLILPFIVPYLALVGQLRESRPLALALSLAATPTDYLAAAPFNRVFGPLTEIFRTRPGFIGENTLFVGIVAGILMLFGLVGSVKCQVSSVKCQVSGVKCPVPGVKGGISLSVFYALLAIMVVSLLLTFPTPYAFLATLFPPSTIVRVPSRWIIPALFALSGLATFGFVFLTHHAPRITHHVIFALVFILLIVESLSIPLPLAFVENQQTLNPAYHWLAAQPGDIALVELPLHSAPAPEYPEVKRMYASTLGWWQLINGYSGYTPPRQPELAQALANFPNDESVNTLADFVSSNPSSFIPSTSLRTGLHPSSFILVHPGEAPLDRTQWESTGRWRAERQPALYPVGEFAGDYLYQVLPENGPQFATPLATFGPDQSIRLLAAHIELSDLRNTQHPIPQFPLASRLLLYWQTNTPLPSDATVFIHLRAADGFVRSQVDGPPVSGHYPLTQWQPGEVVQDIHPLPLEDFALVDHLAIGLYDPATGQRLPAFGPAGQPLPDDAVVVRIEK